MGDGATECPKVRTECPPARRRDAEANRKRILAAAAEAFAAEGLGVSMVEIARRAGVGNATVHRNFSCKQQLLNELVQGWFDRRRVAALAGLCDSDPWRGFAGFIEDAMADGAANRAASDLYAIQLRGGERLYGVLRKLMKRAQVAGVMRSDVTPQDVLTLIMGVKRTIEVTADLAPQQWRRHLAVMLAGLRSEAREPLPGRPIELSVLEHALQQWAKPMVGPEK
jgi:AcrR family transcriptional regulator